MTAWCQSCGQPWPCDGSWRDRAEARIARLEAALRRHTRFFTDSHDTELCGGCLEPSPCPDAGLLP